MNNPNSPAGKLRSCMLLLILSLALSLHSFEALPRMSPDAAGVDPQALSDALQDLSTTPGCWSIVVCRHGALLAESYFLGNPQDLHPIWSVTKSVTSALSGIALDRNIYPELDLKMVDFLPPDLVPPEAIKKRITLRHLLMMTSGLQWSEDYDWLPWLASPDPADFILSRPVDSLPGSSFNYSSAGAHLPSVMLQTALGEDVTQFADTALFQPLGISDWSWDQDPQGYAFGGHGLHWRTEDLAKFGAFWGRCCIKKCRQIPPGSPKNRQILLWEKISRVILGSREANRGFFEVSRNFFGSADTASPESRFLLFFYPQSPQSEDDRGAPLLSQSEMRSIQLRYRVFAPGIPSFDSHSIDLGSDELLAADRHSVGKIAQTLPEHPPCLESSCNLPLENLLRNRGLTLFRRDAASVVQQLPKLLQRLFLRARVEKVLQGCQPPVFPDLPEVQ